LVFKR